MSFPTINDILNELVEKGQIDALPEIDNALMMKVITGINTDRDAGEGELAWLSERVLQDEPDRVKGFGGSCLLLPTSCLILPNSNTNSVLIHCKSPKSALSLLASKFFDKYLDHIHASSKNIYVDSSAVIHESAVLEPFVVVGPNCKIGPNTIIGAHTVLRSTTVGCRTVIGSNCSVGGPGFGFSKGEKGEWIRFPHLGRVEIGDDVTIGSNTCIDRGSLGATRIRNGAKVDNLVHVAHNVEIGERSMIIANTMIGGSVLIGHDAWVAPSVSILNQRKVGVGATVGLGAVVLKDVDANATVVGNPARVLEKGTK